MPQVTKQRIKKPVPTVMFAQCKEHLDHFQYWNDNNIIYSVCKACGETTSYDYNSTCINYLDHYNLYKIALRRNRGEDWNLYWGRAKKLVMLNPQKYMKG